MDKEVKGFLLKLNPKTKFQLQNISRKERRSLQAQINKVLEEFVEDYYQANNDTIEL